MQKLIGHVNVALSRVMTLKVEDLKREDGQGATEYAFVLAFVIIGLTVALGTLGGSIQTFLGKVGTALTNITVP